VTGRPRPNIVMITTDHQRADSIGMVQCGTEVTPHLNRLAQSSITFSRAYNVCPLCVPARTALATGTYPTKNGVVLNKTQTSQGYPTMHQYLHDSGYTLGHAGVNHVCVSPALQEAVLFEKWLGVPEYKQYFSQTAKPEHANVGQLGSFSTKVREFREGSYVPTSYSNSNTAVWFNEPVDRFMDMYFSNEAVSFIEEQAANRQEGAPPWALFVNLWAPHPPLVVPEPYSTLFAPDQLTLPPNVGVTAAREPAGRRQSVPAQLAEGVTIEQWRKAWSAHLQLTYLADECVGRILAALDNAGFTDDTVVLFTSDHGDHLGQHRMYQKMEMYEQAVRVPLLLRLPGTAPKVVDRPVSHLDVFPTLLTCAGIPVPADADGVPLQEYMNGTTAHGADRAVFSQYSGNPAVGDIRRAIITQRFKYVYTPGEEGELYVLQADPLEMTNVATEREYGPVRLELHRRLKEWGEQHGDWVEY
jgi:arylsulfatase A-like enzyme